MSDLTKWTLEQKEAIESIGQDLLLSASAGAGKTAVLTERLLYMLAQKKIELEKLVVVTFTKAAAKEMKERLEKKIVQKITDNKKDFKGEEKKFWQEQKFLLFNAQINTIHALCSNLLRRYFYLLDLAPDFRIAEEAETKLLQNEALEEVLQKFYFKEDFANFAWHYAEDFDDEKLKAIILECYDFVRCQPYYEEWLTKLETLFLPLEVSMTNWAKVSWGDVLLNDIKRSFLLAKEMLNNALLMAEDAKFSKYVQKITLILQDLKSGQEALEKVNGFSSFATLKEYLNNLEELKGGERGSKKTGSDEIAREISLISKLVRDKYLKPLLAYFTRSAEMHFDEATKVRQNLVVLASLVKEFDACYQTLKRENNILDFADLEHFTLRLLYQKNEQEKMVLSEVAKSLQEETDMVIIDEYQDVNELQECILQALAGKEGEGRLFMVGDIKQSIYRFRHAEPALFLSKYQRFSLEKEAKLRKILLSKNFRSTKEVIEAVNSVFDVLMTGGITEINYTKEEFLQCGRLLGSDYKPEKAELVLIKGRTSIRKNEKEEDAKDDEDNEGVDLKTVEAQAHYIAQRILKMVQSGFLIVNEKGVLKKVDYQDFAVLFRTNKVLNIFQKIFLEYQIPLSSQEGKLFETAEVKILLALLQVIDNPLQDLPLMAVLRSFFVGLSDDELLLLKICQEKTKQDYLYLLLIESGENLNTYLTKDCLLKVQTFLEHLKKWRQMSRQCNVRALLEEIIRTTDYDYFLGIMPCGKERQENLNALLMQAKAYEQTAYKGLFRFLQFVEKAREKDSKFGQYERYGNLKAVTFITMHRSKGLEFPVVFLAKSDSSIKSKSFSCFNFHKKIATGAMFYDRDLGLKRKTLSLKAFNILQEEEQLADELRLLYVAMTRAREKLIVVGSYKERKDGTSLLDEVKRLKEGEKVNALRLLKETKSWLEWVYLVAKDSDKWLLVIKEQDEILKEKDTLGITKEIPEAVLQDKILENEEQNLVSPEKIKQALHWSYSKEVFLGYRKKLTVTEIKQLETPKIFKMPQLALKIDEKTKRKMTAQEIGNLHHKIMQYIDYQKCTTKENILQALELLKEKGVLEDAETDYIQIDTLQAFFTSKLGKRLLCAKKVKREQVFALKENADSVYQNPNCKESVLVQGAIDCLFWEDDGWVLIDYKTDSLSDKESLKKIYGVQIAYYKKAIEKITKSKVKESYLYMLMQGKDIAFF